jgi:hypothetical protein
MKSLRDENLRQMKRNDSRFVLVDSNLMADGIDPNYSDVKKSRLIRQFASNLKLQGIGINNKAVHYKVLLRKVIQE